MSQPLDFETIWSDEVMPLAGRKVFGFNGLTNDIVSVDWNGLVRISRNGLASRIPIKPFRWTVDRVLDGRTVERKAINAEFPHRYSSGVLIVLEQVSMFEVSERPAWIRLRGTSESQAIDA